MIARAALALVAVAAGAACRIDARSDDFRCESQDDCGDGRTCSPDGWCVTGDDPIDASIDATPDDGRPPADAPGCPAACTTCQDDTCIITCDGSSECGDGVTCPPGLACQVMCTGTGSCAGPIDCAAATACEISCLGTGSCGDDVTCGPGACTILCDAAGTCAGALDCSASCACDTECTGPGACGGTTSCPAGMPPACRGDDTCTSGPGACDDCPAP